MSYEEGILFVGQKRHIECTLHRYRNTVCRVGDLALQVKPLYHLRFRLDQMTKSVRRLTLWLSTSALVNLARRYSIVVYNRLIFSP